MKKFEMVEAKIQWAVREERKDLYCGLMNEVVDLDDDVDEDVVQRLFDQLRALFV